MKNVTIHFSGDPAGCSMTTRFSKLSVSTWVHSSVMWLLRARSMEMFENLKLHYDFNEQL